VSYLLAPAVLAAVVAAVVSLLTALLSTPLRYALDKRALRYRLSTEYEYEQRKRLRELIGRYIGRMLEASDRLNNRLWNLYVNESKGWLVVDGKYDDLESHYYFRSFVYRFMCLAGIGRAFDAEAIYLDARIAEPGDLCFLRMVRALYWVATDVELFEGLDYDTYNATDHFFSDDLRLACERFWDGEHAMSLGTFRTALGSEPAFLCAAQFFDGLCAGEKRLRWDRLVCFHLTIIMFLNRFGYDHQHTSAERCREVSSKVRHPVVLRNLAGGLSRVGFAEDPTIRPILTNLGQSPEPAAVSVPLPAGYAPAAPGRG
jgi:hypothetical protein